MTSMALYVCDVMLLCWPRWLTSIGPHGSSYVFIITGPLGPCNVLFFLNNLSLPTWFLSLYIFHIYKWPTWSFIFACSVLLLAHLALLSLAHMACFYITSIWPAWQFPNIKYYLRTWPLLDICIFLIFARMAFASYLYINGPHGPLCL